MHLVLLAALLTSIAPVQHTEPNREPALASAPGLTVLAFGSGGTIWFSASRDNGVTFSKPLEVANVPVLPLGRHRGPRIAISGSTIVITAVTGQTPAAGPHAHGLATDGNLMAWRSSDGGISWSKPVTINDVPGSAREGLHAIAAGPHGELAEVWLDLRANGTRLYGAVSPDHGASWSKNVLLYESPGGTICQCCGPSLVFTGPRHVAVMFRNVAEGCRDMNLLTWNLNGPISEPEKLGIGSWQINACPMDGGGVARVGKQIFTAWRRDETVYLDQPGKAEVPLGRGKDVALAASKDGPYIIWNASPGIELWNRKEVKPVAIAESGAFPTLTVTSHGTVLAAWEQDGSIKVEIVRRT